MKPKIMSIKAMYCQEPDSGDDTPGMPKQVLCLEMTHCGQRPYLVIQTDRWSMDRPKELHRLVKNFAAQVEALFDQEPGV